MSPSIVRTIRPAAIVSSLVLGLVFSQRALAQTAQLTVVPSRIVRPIDDIRA